MSIFKSSTVEEEDIIKHKLDRRTKYGYLHPTPPYEPVIRTSHTCNITTIKNNETIQEVVHLMWPHHTFDFDRCPKEWNFFISKYD